MKLGTSASRRKKLINQLDEVVSKIVRLREPYCVTCGTTENLTCSHLITRNKKSIRWNLDNCHCQCKSCNFRHEYYPEIYTEWWLNKYDQEKYSELIKMGNVTKKWTLEELEALLKFYQKLLKTYETNERG